MSGVVEVALRLDPESQYPLNKDIYLKLKGPQYYEFRVLFLN